MSKPKLSPALVTARKELADMIEKKRGEESLPLEDKLAVVDRLLKIEALEYKMGAGKAGAAFDDDDEEGD